MEQQQGRGTSRRKVVAGAAWSIPAIATAAAAPRVAASVLCAPTGYVMDWSYGAGAFTSTPSGSGPYASWTWAPNALQGQSGFVISGSASYSNATQSPVSMTFRSQTAGALSGMVMGIVNGNNTTDTGCFTFSMTQTLKHLSFSIGDIDFGNHENVWISPAPTSYTIQDDTRVGGSGTAADPWKSLVNSDVDITTSNAGSVTVHYDNVSSFTICLSDRALVASGWTSNITMTRWSFDCPTWS